MTLSAKIDLQEIIRMQYLYIAILFVLFSISSTNASDIESHLFILSGQSNMDYLNPSIFFIPAVEAAFGKDNMIVVKDAHSNQPIRRWYTNWKPAQGDKPRVAGGLYDILIKQINVAIKGKKLQQ